MKPPPRRGPAIGARVVTVPRLPTGVSTAPSLSVATGLVPRPTATAIPGAKVAGTTDGATRARAGAATRHPIGSAGRRQEAQPPVLALGALAVIPLTGRVGHALPAVLAGQAATTTPILSRVGPLLMGIASTQEAMQP